MAGEVFHRSGLVLEFYRGLTGRYRWRLMDAQNGKNMANGSQGSRGYADKRDMRHGALRTTGAWLTRDGRCFRMTAAGYVEEILFRDNS